MGDAVPFDVPSSLLSPVLLPRGDVTAGCPMAPSEKHLRDAPDR